MKLLKKVLIVLVSVIGIILIIALFVESKYDVNRSIIINQPKNLVFDYLKHVKNQNEYAVWNQLDPNIEQYYNGTDGEVGFIYSWKSSNEKVGTGEQEIMLIKEEELIDLEMRFSEPMEMIGNAYFETTTIEKGTKVTWGFRGESSYPFNISLLIFDMEEMLGPDLEKGLDNLKEVLESNR